MAEGVGVLTFPPAIRSAGTCTGAKLTIGGSGAEGPRCRPTKIAMGPTTSRVGEVSMDQPKCRWRSMNRARTEKAMRLSNSTIISRLFIRLRALTLPRSRAYKRLMSLDGDGGGGT